MNTVSTVQGIVTVFLLVSSIITGVDSSLGKVDPISAHFSLPNANNGEEFQNFVIDTSLTGTDRLYLGATNSLYQLADTGSGLQLKEYLRTGPELDSPLCNYNGDCILTGNENGALGGGGKKNAAVNKTWTNNYNQILLIHPSRKVLIACGSVKQGLCGVHRLENISRVITIDRPVPVAANSDNATTAAFLGPGPDVVSPGMSNSDSQSHQTVLYVAATFTTDPYRDTFPSVSTRSLSDDRLFQLVDPGDVIGQSGLMIRNEYRSDFRVYYVGGFYSDSYAYWASVQRKSAVDPSSPYVSKLLRVCAQDMRYESYAELPLECLGPDNSQYNIMKAFYHGQLGDDAMSSGTDEGTNGKRRRKINDEYLVGIFVKGTDPWKYGMKGHSSSGMYNHLTAQSAICIFSMKDIRAAFMFNLQRCNSGIGRWNLPHFGFDQKCHNISNQQPNEHRNGFCQPIRVGGEMPATSAALITYKDQMLTSIAADVVAGRTVLFAGTASGTVKKIYLQTIKNGREYGEIQLTRTTAGGTEINEPVQPSMQFDRSKRNLFVMTSTEMFKVRVETCAMYEKCDTCLGSRDPYCGWCTLENRCSTKTDCPLSSIPHGFLTTRTSVSDGSSSGTHEACPRIDYMNPMNASLYAPMETELQLQFNFLPPPSDDGGVYQCIFNTKTVPAQYIEPNTLKCHLPPYSDRPAAIDKNSEDALDRRDHVGVPLKIWSSASSAVFYETQFLYYDCGAHQLCTSCVSSRWPCDWCLVENRCIHDAQICGIDRSATGKKDTPNIQQVRITHSLSRHHRHAVSKHVLFHVHEKRYRRGGRVADANGLAMAVHDAGSSLPQGNQCPHIDVHHLPEILLPDGYPVAVVVPVLNLDKLLPFLSSAGSVNLECVTRSENRDVRVRGTLSADSKTVQCENFAYSYDANVNSTTASFHLRTPSGTVIDRMQVRMYKCNLLGPDCSRCLNIDARYQCTWCEGSCQYSRRCPVGTVPSIETARDACPAPVIRSVTPLVGPLEGGTRLEITGLDIGVRRQEVEGRIFIGGRVPCDVEQEGYKLAQKVVCRTRATSQPFEGPVEIRLDNQKTGRSEQLFKFVQPVLRGFQPDKGPKSGGTELIIDGEHLLDASDVRVFLGALKCDVNRAKSTTDRLVCVTSKSERPHLTMDKLTVLLDKANRTLAGKFEYTPDPMVTSVQPMTSFQSGGRRLLIKGDYFTSIQKPLLYFYAKTRSTEPRVVSDLAICEVQNSTVMICPSPAVVSDPKKLIKRVGEESQDGDGDEEETVRGREEKVVKEREEREPTVSLNDQYGIGFVMDGVESLRQVARFAINVYPDPIYEQFPDGKKVHRGEPLIISGKYLNLASTERDVTVLVGDEQCNVTLIAADKLVCQPPVNKPIKQTNDDASQPLVQVQVGSLSFTLGELIYDLDSSIGSSAGSNTLDMALVGGVVGGCAALFVVAMVAAAVWWQKKSWQAEKEYKRIQLQMDTLESNVRQECKQAFAELQTDMSDLTGDLVALGIPYHTRRSYAAKILFKEEHQAALRMLDWQHSNGHGYNGPLNQSLLQFEQLLWKKEFVIQMVNSLENQSTFGSQDRVYVASLLTASLAKNMAYLTELVMELLSTLITKATQNRFPQLMLRRTESVVEKMLSNWIALCMYDYMLEAPGGALFLMFKALKHQVEKGPVDQVTADARYCLSEDRLLKEQIDSEPILLRVVPPSTESNAAETVLCRVLSCDTISQVKSKILDALYRNTPDCARPGRLSSLADRPAWPTIQPGRLSSLADQ